MNKSYKYTFNQYKKLIYRFVIDFFVIKCTIEFNFHIFNTMYSLIVLYRKSLIVQFII